MKHTTFDLKDNKLVKRPDRPIKYKSGLKTYLLKPEDALYDAWYSNIAYYSVKKKPYTL